MRTWPIIAAQFVLAPLTAAALALAIRFPDVARRPDPPPTILLACLFVAFTLAIAALTGVGVHRRRVGTLAVVGSGLLAWLLGGYALAFVWINTFGT